MTSTTFRGVNTAAGPVVKINTDISYKRIGIITGTAYDSFVSVKYPHAEIFRFDSRDYMIMALKSSKIDVVVLDRISAVLFLKRNPDLVILTDSVMEIPLGVGFNKDKLQLIKEFNNFLAEIRRDGTLDQMKDRWFLKDAEEAEVPGFKTITSDKKIVAGVSIENLPYVAEKNGEYTGFDIELLKRFSERYNYELKIVTFEYADLLASVYSGKIDMIADGISINAEYSGQINFSDEYFRSPTCVLATRKTVAGYSETIADIHPAPFLKRTAVSIYNTLISDGMYMLILKGLCTTIVISVFSAIIGIIMGGLICMMIMSKNKYFKWLGATYITIIRGIPLLLLLLVVYFVIFASVSISPVIVAIIAFGVNSAAYVSVIFRTSIESIDKGQKEAAIALGFTKIRTFTDIIMPQAFRKILPIYKGEIVSIVKMTSVVGFIAVEDLTKVSNIIRSRTLDTFSPLIIAAVIYFLITLLLTSLIGYIEINLDPKRRRFKFKKMLGK